MDTASKGHRKDGKEDHHLVRMTFRELWDKGASDKRIWLCAVYIVWGKEVD